MKKLIDKDLIKSLNPCSDRFDNYLKFYGDRSFTKGQFMGLKNISHLDKLWVAFRLIPKENVVLAAADIAESVLHIFEDKFPFDLRPRKAIEAARNKDKDASFYAYDAATAAYSASFSADNAAYAAANAANSAAYAANSAANAAADAADNAAYASYDAAASVNTKEQEKLIRKIVLKYWR